MFGVVKSVLYALWGVLAVCAKLALIALGVLMLVHVRQNASAVATGILLVLIGVVLLSISELAWLWKWLAEWRRDKQAPTLEDVAELPAPGFAALSARFRELCRHDALACVEPDGSGLSWNSQEFGVIRVVCVSEENWVCLFWGRTLRRLGRRTMSAFASAHGVALSQVDVLSAPDAVGFCCKGQLRLYPRVAAAEFGDLFMDSLLGTQEQFQTWLREYADEEE